MTLPALGTASQALTNDALLMERLAGIVIGAQLFHGVAATMVFWHYLPSFWRVAIGRTEHAWDGAGCWGCIFGVGQVGFIVRWIFFPEPTPFSYTLWISLYVLGGASLLGILYTWRDVDYQAAIMRARTGVWLWVFIAIACIGAASWSL